eukprot:2053122-Pyramimonas_sp.AAC.1
MTNFWSNKAGHRFGFYSVEPPGCCAFRATKPDCLAVRAAVVVIAGVDFMPIGRLRCTAEFFLFATAA